MNFYSLKRPPILLFFLLSLLFTRKSAGSVHNFLVGQSQFLFSTKVLFMFNFFSFIYLLYHLFVSLLQDSALGCELCVHELKEVMKGNSKPLSTLQLLRKAPMLLVPEPLNIIVIGKAAAKTLFLFEISLLKGKIMISLVMQIMNEDDDDNGNDDNDEYKNDKNNDDNDDYKMTIKTTVTKTMTTMTLT